MRVLFIVPYPVQGASNRLRVQQYLPFLEAHEVCCRVRPFYSEALWRILYRPGHHLEKLLRGLGCLANRALDLGRSLSCELVLIHREAAPAGPAWFERALRLMGKPYAYDFDDAVWLPNVAPSNRLFARLKCPGKVAGIVRGSALALAGNHYLADWAVRAGARAVEVLPTVVDTARVRPPEARQSVAERPVVIGWIGSPTTIAFLEDFRPVLARVLERCAGKAVFRVVGGTLAGPLPAGIECAPWSLEGELAELQGFDLGVMPMPDNEWTRGKCAFKAIEYMAVGVPAVCSPVGTNCELIEDGRTGFLPADDDQWVETICRLVADPALRQRVGLAGRQVIERGYSLESAAPRLLAALRRAAGTAREVEGEPQGLR